MTSRIRKRNFRRNWRRRVAATWLLASAMLSCFTDQNRHQNSQRTDYCEPDPIVRKTKIITGRDHDNDDNGYQGCAGVLAPLHPALARSAGASCFNWPDPGSGCE